MQAQLLEVTAVTIDLLHIAALTGRGADASLFTFVPRHPGQRRVGAGSLPAAPRSTSGELCRKAQTALEETIRAARDDPAIAQGVYNLCLVGCRTPEAAERGLDDFGHLGIPIDQLSHKPTAGIVRVR